jgi:hypothetical protein
MTGGKAFKNGDKSTFLKILLDMLQMGKPLTAHRDHLLFLKGFEGRTRSNHHQKAAK